MGIHFTSASSGASNCAFEVVAQAGAGFHIRKHISQPLQVEEVSIYWGGALGECGSREMAKGRKGYNTEDPVCAR